MKKIIFTAYSLEMGGIERALVTLLKTIDYKKYEVTLVLEKKQGIFLNQIPKQVKILEYEISDYKFIPIRKIINRLKLIKTIISRYHKYDFACCYTPYSIPGSILTKYFSKNNAIWIHSDYYYLYDKDENRIRQFFNDRSINKFEHIVFVAEEARNHFNQIYPNLENKAVVCNNLVDDSYIIEKSSENISDVKPNVPLFINISRHEEKAKKLTRLIEAASLLKKAGYKFEVWLIGNGEDTPAYEKLIKKLKLEPNVKLLGFKSNPYPYYKIADAFVLTSEYEGFPVVYLESIMLNVPIITTIDVSGNDLTIKNCYGLIASKDVNDIFNKMKQFLDKGFTIKKPFDASKYNLSINKIINDMFNNKWQVK